MITENGIAIQNIYYMLSYAYTILQSDGYDNLKNEHFENTLELLSEILTKGISYEIKRGLGKEYNYVEENLSTLKGKIDISKSIKNQTFLHKKMICSYDEFSINTKFNQILKATITMLIKQNNLSLEKRKKLKKLIIYFSEVETVNVKSLDWKLRYNRNNKNYEMLVNVCKLIIDALIQSDEKGGLKLEKFLNEQELYNLYEKFVLEYYKKHLPKTIYYVGSKKIEWAEDNKDIEFLPNMQTDIYITNKNTNKRLIIDTKFYKSIMQSYYGAEKFHSNNLYQIFTYVKNESSNIGIDSDISGMLLYAKTNYEEPPKKKYNLNKNTIHIETLDLGQEFEYISNTLNSFINEWENNIILKETYKIDA